MGYTIMIGQGIKIEPEEEGCIDFDCEFMELYPEAPANEGALDPYANRRLPSYSGWGMFADQTGLREFFFNPKTGVMREHPGMVKLLPEHLETVKKAAKRFKNNERFDWMIWWMTWALKNCSNPVFFNS